MLRPSVNRWCVKIASVLLVAYERLLDRVRHFVEPRFAIFDHSVGYLHMLIVRRKHGHEKVGPMPGRKDQSTRPGEGSRCNCTAPRKASRRGWGSIAAVQSLHFAAWIERQTRAHAAPTVKLRLSALRHLFDWLAHMTARSAVILVLSARATPRPNCAPPPYSLPRHTNTPIKPLSRLATRAGFQPRSHPVRILQTAAGERRQSPPGGFQCPPIPA